jgi:glycyl-tRNA synthetase
LSFFVVPGSDEEWHKTWVDARLKWWDEQGVNKDNIELYEVPKDELAHYSKATVDIMYRFPHGLEELEGIANRTDFDLGSHSKNQKELNIHATVMENNESNARLATQNLETNEWSVPYVIEPSAGVDRGVLAVLNEAYKVEELEDGKTRTVLNLKPHLSPIKAAVIPLKKNHDGLVDIASTIKKDLQKLRLGRILLENSGNIGKSYRRHDEIGTPLCITVDFDSLEDSSVTIRDRDTMQQKRIEISKLSKYLEDLILK